MKAKTFIGILMVLLLVLPSGITIAHCDTMEGPVIKAAKEALKKGDINYVLMWIKKDDEATIKKLFEEVLKVRKLSKEAETLADMYFFESLVRIHRAGEGASYTGLKSGEVEEPIAMADKAIESGSIADLQVFLKNAVDTGLVEKFKTVLAKKKFDISKPDEGREYVEAYIVFTHYVEGLHAAIEKVSDEHSAAGEGEETHAATAKCSHEDAAAETSHSCVNPIYYILIILGALNFIGLVIVLGKIFKTK